MNEILTPEKRRRAIEKEYAKIFAEQSNRIITNKVYEQLLEQRKEVDRVLKKVKEDIGQEEYAQHYKNLLNKYGQNCYASREFAFFSLGNEHQQV